MAFEISQRDMVLLDIMSKGTGEAIGRATAAIETRLKALESLVEAMMREPGPPGPQGEPGPPGQSWTPQGTFDPGASYGLFAVVQHDGAAWLALHDDPGELPGPGWQMIASRGRAGKNGEAGQQGPAGKDGKGIEAGARFIVEMANGEIAEAVAI